MTRRILTHVINYILFILGLKNNELNHGFLHQQLNNPQINQRDREVLFAVWSYFNPAQPSPPENNMPHPVPHPNDVSHVGWRT